MLNPAILHIAACHLSKNQVVVGVIILKRKWVYIVLVTLLTFLLQACVSKEEAGEDLMQYFNTDKNSAEKEHYNEVLTKKFDMEDENLDEKTAIHMSEEIIPALENVIDYLESLEYKSSEVRKLNKMNIKLQTFAYKMFQDIARSFSEGSTVDEVNSEFFEKEREVKRKSDRYFEYRDKLIKKYELERYSDYEGDGTGEDKLRRKTES